MFDWEWSKPAQTWDRWEEAVLVSPYPPPFKDVFILERVNKCGRDRRREGRGRERNFRSLRAEHGS